MTLEPNVDGLSEEAIDVELRTRPTVWFSAPLLEAVLLASPPYAAVMLCVPLASELLVHCAVLLLPLPASATALQPA
ncbi:MAG: hypothetical protein ACREYD_01630, partial [Casimicrobiaceae bacterium]